MTVSTKQRIDEATAPTMTNPKLSELDLIHHHQDFIMLNPEAQLLKENRSNKTITSFKIIMILKRGQVPNGPVFEFQPKVWLSLDFLACVLYVQSIVNGIESSANTT